MAKKVAALPNNVGIRPHPHAGPRGHGLRHILICLDHSAYAETCLAYAASLSKSFGSALTLLHVLPPPTGLGPQATDMLAWEISRAEASAYLDRFQSAAARASDGGHVEARLEQGRPAERIVAMARELEVDLVVLGSRDEAGASEWTLGRTAQQVLAAVPSSVFVVRAPPSANLPSMKRILVPLDGSLRTESVLPIAARLGKTHRAELVLVHVVHEPVPTAVLCAPEDLELARELEQHLETHADRYLGGLRDALSHEGSTIHTRVARDADQAQRLLRFSDEEGIDLIVLSAHGSTCNAGRPFGSIAAHLLTHSTVPLLVLQDLPDFEFPREGKTGPRAAPPPRATFPPEGA